MHCTRVDSHIESRCRQGRGDDNNTPRNAGHQSQRNASPRKPELAGRHACAQPRHTSEEWSSGHSLAARSPCPCDGTPCLWDARCVASKPMHWGTLELTPCMLDRVTPTSTYTWISRVCVGNVTGVAEQRDERGDANGTRVSMLCYWASENTTGERQGLSAIRGMPTLQDVCVRGGGA